MCGITGIISSEIPEIELQDTLKKSVRCLSSRGPDNEGIYFDKKLALGHRRLSIIDTSTNANQPFF